MRRSVNIGADPKLSFNKKQKVWLTNAGTLLAMTASGVYMMSSLYIWDSWLNASFNLITILIFSSVLWLNKFGKHKQASIIYLLLLLIICYLNIFMYGSNLMLYMIMIPWLVLAIFLLDSPLCITVAVVLGIFSFVFFESYSNHFDSVFNDTSYLPSRISIGLGLSAFVTIVLFYKGNHDNYERIIKSKNSALKHKQNEIEVRNQKLKEQKEEIESQNNHLKFANHEMKASMTYSKRIQTALLPDMERYASFFSEFFVYYHPKDIVSGDFYWAAVNENKLLIATADCTGHGVPGAMMTAICHSILQNAVFEANITNPADILMYANNRLQSTLNHRSCDKTIIRDGMDIALCLIDPDTSEIVFAGAKRSLYFVRDNSLTIFRGTKRSIGGGHCDNIIFQQEHISYTANDSIYMFTDGLTDQFGGPMNKKFLTKQIQNFIGTTNHLHMNEQKKKLNKTMIEWTGKNEQTDDMLMMGFRM